MNTIFLVTGILLLWGGGEAFLHGSVAVATRFRVSQLMIGLTLVGFGTSLPELVTSVTAVLSGAPGISVGNVVGSNIANILLILGLASLIRPIACQPEAFYRDAVALAAGTLAGTLLIVGGYIGAVHGFALVTALALYIIIVYRGERAHPSAAGAVLVGEAEVTEIVHPAATLTAILVVGGLAGVIAGAWLLVEGAMGMAVSWGVSETFIGLTIVAIGTSLPELVICGIASLRGRSDVALGNIMGSNMFNILGILGATAIVRPINVPADLSTTDITIMMGATALLIVSAATKLRILRWEGALFLVGYALYLSARPGMSL